MEEEYKDELDAHTFSQIGYMYDEKKAGFVKDRLLITLSDKYTGKVFLIKNILENGELVDIEPYLLAILADEHRFRRVLVLDYGINNYVGQYGEDYQDIKPKV